MTQGKMLGWLYLNYMEWFKKQQEQKKHVLAPMTESESLEETPRKLWKASFFRTSQMSLTISEVSEAMI